MKTIAFPAIEVVQPIGSFFIGVMAAGDLLAVSYVDMRRIESDLDNYIGIQRSLSKQRVLEIAEFVKSIDATFPTSVVLAVKGECADFCDGKLKLSEARSSETGGLISFDNIASILDGQHRVEGLREAGILDFQVPVSIFVDADIADQAYIFATVNLAQTKVNKSLVFDLLDYAAARSPQKSAHDIAVALDRHEKSPFRSMIKRLGTRTQGRVGETLAQATFVNALIPFVSRKPELDRYTLAKGRKVSASDTPYSETPFRFLWVEERDTDIAKILRNYFDAVREVWPHAWASREKGQILPRTNGFRAMMRLLKLIYLKEYPQANPGNAVPSVLVFKKYLDRSSLEDDDFNVVKFIPGTGGETALFNHLRGELNL